MKTKNSNSSEPIIPIERIQDRILLIRGQKVLLDAHLAELYGVETGQLKRQVRRNIEHFPKDFMFELSVAEYNSLRCQIGTLEKGEHAKYLPFVFTEQGVAMLSSVLNSKRAILVNIAIMRTFVQMRNMLESNAKFAIKLKELEDRMDMHDENTIVVMSTLRKLLNDSAAKAPLPAKQKIGFPA